MHYPRTAFSIDGSDTITPIDPTAQLGQRVALSAGDIATANSMCAKVIKEVVKDGPWDTRKELVKDIRFDTRKELIFDTRKELIKDRIKEVALDPPFRKPAADVIGPVVTPVQPGLRHLVTPVQPGLRPAGGVPFAVATPHQAPAAAREEAELEAVVGNLDAQLEALAEQIAQLDASRESLQAQYDEMARLLQQAVEAHDQPATP
jgi:polyhydroxyalkanoate synthesis regulator phasin